ncbi:MAG: flagellar export protein FliJ [Chitinivibrionia bacterium]|nr:flagellar export protein FliJ [Chitinivibrionia bacterium]
MKRFEFNLQSILELRVREEDEAKAFLMSQEAEWQKVNAEFHNKREELQNFQTREKETRKDADSTVSTLKYSISWRNSLKLELLKLGQQLQDISIDVARAKDKLTEATIKRKSLETLRDKKKSQWQKEFNKNEQKFLDEIAQSRQNFHKNS